jgi:hypothetical protein
MCRRGSDTLLKQEQFSWAADASEEDSGPIKEAQTSKPYGYARRLQLAEPCDQAVILFRARIAEELQRYVPRLRR